MHGKFGDVQTLILRCVWTERHAHPNDPLPYRAGVMNSVRVIGETMLDTNMRETLSAARAHCPSQTPIRSLQLTAPQIY